MDKFESISKIVDSVSDATKKIIPLSAGEADMALSTLIGFFNNVVLYPVKKANISFKYKLENFQKDIENRVNVIPENNIQPPSLMIAGPTLEALRYSYDEENIRNMFENLLASAMDNRVSALARPSFVEAIKQMTPLDSIVLKSVSDKGRMRCSKVIFRIANTNQIYTYGMPTYFIVELKQIEDPFLVSSSLINLDRLGLIEITDGRLNGADYESVKEDDYVEERLQLFKGFGKEIEVEIDKRTVIFTDYGRDFVTICLKQ